MSIGSPVLGRMQCGMSRQRLSVALLLLPFVHSQNVSVPVAQQQLPGNSSTSGVENFPFETIQLTSEVLSSLESYDLSQYEVNNVSIFDFGSAAVAALDRKRSKAVCKYMPGDAEWPSSLVWTLFDLLLGGNALIKSVPAAAVCYSDWPQYDEEQCDLVTANWTDAVWGSDQPTDVLNPLFEGVTCLPPSFARANATCTLGGYPSYVLNVTSVAQIQLAMNFARNLNLRLVIKNSGHDFNAKSTGAGALSLWTHFLQDIQYLGADYSAAGFSGPAFKVGAGVTVGQMYSAADELDLEIVGAIARTIGIAGGYIAGGGNSPLISKYGMAADQVLSLEVVLPNGQFVSVDEKNNPDLFFALRGGGGSTWGVVTSVVLRAYPKEVTTSLTYSFGPTDDPELFWAGVDLLFDQFPVWPEHGLYSYWSILCSTNVSCVVYMAPQIGPGFNQTQLETLNAPFLANLTALDISIDDLTYTQYDSYLEMFDATWPESTNGGGTWTEHTASRLFPKANWEDPTKLNSTIAAIRTSAEESGYFLAYNVRPVENNPAINQNNSVNPAWRNTLLFAMLGATWDQNATSEDIAEANKGLVEALNPWREASPDSGTYLNEADINEPNLQQAFYGDNYDYLYELKQKYDPWGVLYSATAVGAEDWYITDQIEYYPTQDGRLCPTS